MAIFYAIFSFIFLIFLIMLVLAITKNINRKTDIIKSKEKTDSIKRRIDTEILIDAARRQGIGISEHEKELKSLTDKGSLKNDAAFKYINK